jgi:hypothetical protein
MSVLGLPDAICIEITNFYLRLSILWRILSIYILAISGHRDSLSAVFVPFDPPGGERHMAPLGLRHEPQEPLLLG